VRLFAIFALLGSVVGLSGCGQCVPAAAYTVPAYWSAAYYSEESQFSHWRYYESCGNVLTYSYYYNDYYEKYTCNEESAPVYYYYRQYHPKVYHPTQYVPAVTCPKK
jgi:hypothetical protein